MDSAVASGQPRVYTERFIPTTGLPQVPAARHFVRDRLGAEHPCRDDAVLLTSELFTNSCNHTDSDHRGIDVNIVAYPDMVKVSCTDAGGETVPCIRGGIRRGEHGRGLMIVDEVADEWGFVRREDGETETWFVLRPRLNTDV